MCWPLVTKWPLCPSFMTQHKERMQPASLQTSTIPILPSRRLCLDTKCKCKDLKLSAVILSLCPNTFKNNWSWLFPCNLVHTENPCLKSLHLNSWHAQTFHSFEPTHAHLWPSNIGNSLPLIPHIQTPLRLVTTFGNPSGTLTKYIWPHRTWPAIKCTVLLHTKRRTRQQILNISLCIVVAQLTSSVLTSSGELCQISPGSASYKLCSLDATLRFA